jgi:transposase InsO family protein
MDRDTKFCSTFRSLLEDSGVNPVRLPARSPNLNAHLERFIRSLQSERLNRMIFFGEQSVRRAVREFFEYSYRERNHRGPGNRLIVAGQAVRHTSGKTRRHQRLGGLLRYDYRDAA